MGERRKESIVRIDDLKQAKDRRPFEPFEIHLADGRGVTIGHPDALAWEGPDFAPVLFAILPGGKWEVINFAAITSLTLSIRSPGARSKTEGNGA
jgi:hypothetical protein